MSVRSLATSKISLVIPCYDESEVLPLLVERVRKAANDWGTDYEVVLVDDGSTDKTWELICDYHRKDARWKGVRLTRNFGHQIALWTGLKHVTGNVIAVLDADLQDPPEILLQFFAKWAEGFDVVYAVRRERKEGLIKRCAYFIYYRVLSWLSEIDIPLDSGDFCVMDRRVADAMLASHEQVPFVRGLRAWVGFRQTALEYERGARAAGEVKYTFRKLMQLALSGIFSFSTRPLRLATYLGLAVSAAALIGFVIILLQRVLTERVPGTNTVVLAILFLGGVQLLCIGILGEYVGRIYENVKGRPLSVVGERIGIEQTEITPIS
ncbi:MAG: glycosyltransferase family 2 protein [Gemmataceae bacterium]